MQITPANPDPWIQKIALLIGDFYQLFVKMGYFRNGPAAIAYPPDTNLEINTSLAAELGLEPPVVDLLQLLPYVKCNEPKN